MDSMPRIRVKKELFDHIQSKPKGSRVKKANLSPPPEDLADRAANWKKALLIRDLDLVQASIKIIMAMPARSKHILSLGKLIHASLKDVEGVLLHNQIPIRRLDFSSPSSLPWNSNGDTEKLSDASGYSLSGPWRKAVLARNLDLVYTCVHAILLDIPRKDRSQLVDTAFATLKELQSIILNADSSSQQITNFVAETSHPDESGSNAPSSKSYRDKSRTQVMEKRQNMTELKSFMEPENQIESQDNPQGFEDPGIPEEPPKTTSPRNLEEQSNCEEHQEIPRPSNEKVSQTFIGPQDLNNVPTLSVAAAFPDSPKRVVSPPIFDKSNDAPPKLLCSICNRRLTEGRCVACRNFALKMENSMKQNVFYECSHADNSGGVNCKVCRYNLILKFMPNYASRKKIQMIHNQIGPRSKSVQNEDPNVTTQQQHNNVMTTNTNSRHDEEVSENFNPQSLDETSSVDIPPPPPAATSSDESSIGISIVSSLSVCSTAKIKNTCPICKSRAPDGKCKACLLFSQRMESLLEKDFLCECDHENNSGAPKCRVCRYNQVLLVKANQEEKKVVPWNNY